MKSTQLLFLTLISLIFIPSCNNKPKPQLAIFSDNARRYTGEKSDISYTIDEYNNTKGYWENGDIITSFDCPDSQFFPPIDIKSWNLIPVVNERFPTYAETMNGTSIHHYGEKQNAYVKPYSMTLPKLAYHVNTNKRTEFEVKHNIKKLSLVPELVVVIQIVQTAKDTIVGYRYITGGCGGSLFRDFHFLTDDEVREVTGL